MPSLLDRRTALAAAAALIVAVPVAIVAWTGMKKRDLQEGCVQNLVRLGMGIQAGSPRAGAAWDALPTGRKFWLAVPDWPVQLPFPLSPRNLVCPVHGRTTPGLDVSSVDYRGPVRGIRSYEPRDAIGGDRPGNHGAGSGGNLLLRNGEVIPAGETDEAWIRAASTTTD